MKFIKYSTVIFVFIFLGGIFTITNPVLFAGSNANTIDINKAQLQADVNFLCGLKVFRNNEHANFLDTSAQYIMTELKKSGYEPEEQKYTADGISYKNIICSFGPKDAERLIIGAHYDVC